MNSTDPLMDKKNKNDTDFSVEEIKKTFDRDNSTYKRKDVRKENIRQLKKSYKIGRNDPCPCGSGEKYKKCCLKKQENQIQQQKEIRGIINGFTQKSG